MMKINGNDRYAPMQNSEFRIENVEICSGVGYKRDIGIFDDTVETQCFASLSYILVVRSNILVIKKYIEILSEA